MINIPVFFNLYNKRFSAFFDFSRSNSVLFGRCSMKAIAFLLPMEIEWICIKCFWSQTFNADPYNFHGKKKCDCFHGTSAKEDRIAMRKIKEHGESFIVKIEKYRNVNHSPENPVWKIPGFCYLECINLALERGHFWPANPTVYLFANFGQKYRRPINFCLIETEPGKHFTIKTFPDGNSALAWKHLEFLATTKKSFMHVGGNDNTSTFKPLDGTNYKQWAPKMKAYLMSKEL